MEEVLYQDLNLDLDLDLDNHLNEIREPVHPARKKKTTPQMVKDAGNIMEILLGAFAGAVAGGATGLGIDFFGWHKGAILGGTAGFFFAGTGLAAKKLHVSKTIKTISSLAAGGLFAGTASMFLTHHGVLAVSESMGAGVAASLAALWLREIDEINTGTFIAGTALTGALAGACEATKAIGGAVLIGSIALLAKGVKVGLHRVSLWDAKDGLLLGAFIGQILETSEIFGKSASLGIVKEACLAGAGLGAVVGAVYAEKCQQDLIAQSEERRTTATSLCAAATIGAAAAVGGYMTKLVFKHIVPLFI